MKNYFTIILNLKVLKLVNGTPLHTEVSTRDFIRKSFTATEGMRVCNVGIGTGDWDDFLGYWLKDKGQLTSIDLDEEICGIFQYRQERERHPNPSQVICKSIFDPNLPKERYDLVTMIGSAINEIGDFQKSLDACFDLLKSGGYLMFMAHLRYSPGEMVEEYIQNTDYLLEKQKIYKEFPEYPFYICKIKKFAFENSKK
ncbi:class I SAM-dependent methyltransferase [Bacillus sp. SD088]|uniref:class I SAM-dependent methyltransferase n=1 Tax=Bacillus sp. SD088 TaxID=2782012 RepID=UPI001F61496C|nr:class I SAM-dependent methyltransferase [Bacillus sp. SD088]